MDVRTIDLTAGEPLRQQVPHRFFVLLDTQAPLTVKKLDPRALSVDGEIARDVESGFMYWPLNPQGNKTWGGYELLSTTTQSIRIATSYEAGDYRRFLTEVVSQAPADLTDDDDVAVSSVAVEVAPANALRRSVVIQNVGANNVRVGTSSVTATRGTRLLPNGSRVFTTRAAIYAIREGGSNSSVSVSEEVST